MRIAVTGSIATDHLMTFQGMFSESLLPDQLDRVSLSFLVEDLEVRRGGTAANICFGMAAFGVHPVLVGAVGADFAEYRSWLERHGVDCSGVRVSQTRHTARFVCTTDSVQAQIASFYSGAMAESREIELGPLGDPVPLDLVMVGPSDPVAILRHAEECRQRGIPFASDLSQQLAFFDGEQIRQSIDGAAYLFVNDYEAGLIEQKTGWNSDEILRHVQTRIVTHGEKGSVVDGSWRGQPLPPTSFPAVLTQTVLDPTGVGDAYRAGFLTGLAWQSDLTTCAALGSTLATLAIESVGPQDYVFEADDFLQRLGSVYGADVRAEVAARLASSAA